MAGVRLRRPEHRAVGLVPDLPVADPTGVVLDRLAREGRVRRAADGGVGAVLVVRRRWAGPGRGVRQRGEHAHAAGPGGVDERVVVRPAERGCAVPLDVGPLDVDANPAGAHGGQLVQLASHRRDRQVLGVVERHAERPAGYAHGRRRRLGGRRRQRRGRLRLCGRGRRLRRGRLRLRGGRRRRSDVRDRSGRRSRPLGLYGAAGTRGAHLDPVGGCELPRAAKQSAPGRRCGLHLGVGGPDGAVLRPFRRGDGAAGRAGEEREGKRRRKRKDQSSGPGKAIGHSCLHRRTASRAIPSIELSPGCFRGSGRHRR